jgi:hypothetical protein
MQQERLRDIVKEVYILFNTLQAAFLVCTGENFDEFNLLGILRS